MRWVTSYYVFNVNLMDYPGSYGLDLDSSIEPLVLFEELKLDKVLAVPSNERVKIARGGCWILPKCLNTHVAPNSSEQSMSGHFASYGLDLVFSTTPLALVDWLKMNVFSLLSTNMRVSFLMGSCWIMH